LTCLLLRSIAGAFTAVVRSFVSDILTPVLGLIPGIHRNLQELFAVLRMGEQNDHHGYNTMKQALEDGAVVLAYGSVSHKLRVAGDVGEWTSEG